MLAVGVDGSEASVAALEWALRFASEVGAQVDVLTAWPVHAPVFVSEVPGHFSEARWHAVQIQAEAIARATSLVPEAPVIVSRIENATPLEALVRVSRLDSILVLGTDRTPDGGAGAWTSLTVRVRHTAKCPVVLVPRRANLQRDPVSRGEGDPVATPPSRPAELSSTR